MENVEGKMYDLFLGMYKEMVISNQPAHLKSKQRELFQTADSIKHWSSMIEISEENNQSAKTEKYTKWCKEYEEKYDELIALGCVDIDI
jgi:hypothetical protein